jgi:hypothetical protein
MPPEHGSTVENSRQAKMKVKRKASGRWSPPAEAAPEGDYQNPLG